MRVEKILREFKKQKKNKPCKEYFTGRGMKRNQKHEKSKRKVNPVRSCIQIKGRNNKKRVNPTNKPEQVDCRAECLGIRYGRMLCHKI